MSTSVTTNEWVTLTALSLRVLLADPETELPEDAEKAIRGLIEETPADAYDDMSTHAKALHNLVNFMEAINGIATKG